MAQRQILDEVAQLICELANDSETRWSFGSDVRSDGSTHALEEMRNDDIGFGDVVYVLKNCRVVRSQYVQRFDEMRYRAIGKNVDGIKMAFIVTVWEKEKVIEIVTGWVDR